MDSCDYVVYIMCIDKRFDSWVIGCSKEYSYGYTLVSIVLIEEVLGETGSWQAGLNLAIL
jgi:hypothetical protein